MYGELPRVVTAYVSEHVFSGALCLGCRVTFGAVVAVAAVSFRSL